MAPSRTSGEQGAASSSVAPPGLELGADTAEGLTQGGVKVEVDRSSRACPPKYQSLPPPRAPCRSTHNVRGVVVITNNNMSESKKSVEDTLSSAIAQLEEEAALKKVSRDRTQPVKWDSEKWRESSRLWFDTGPQRLGET